MVLLGEKATHFMNNMIGYKSTKNALIGLSEQAACAVAEFGIRVAVVNPGPVATEMLPQKDADAFAQVQYNTILHTITHIHHTHNSHTHTVLVLTLLDLCRQVLCLVSSVLVTYQTLPKRYVHAHSSCNVLIIYTVYLCLYVCIRRLRFWFLMMLASSRPRHSPLLEDRSSSFNLVIVLHCTDRIVKYVLDAKLPSFKLLISPFCLLFQQTLRSNHFFHSRPFTASFIFQQNINQVIRSIIGIGGSKSA